MNAKNSLTDYSSELEQSFDNKQAFNKEAFDLDVLVREKSLSQNHIKINFANAEACKKHKSPFSYLFDDSPSSATFPSIYSI